MIVTRGKNKNLQIDIPAKQSPTGKRIRCSAKTTDMEKAKEVEAQLLISLREENTETTSGNQTLCNATDLLSNTVNQERQSLSLLLIILEMVRREVDPTIPFQMCVTFVRVCLAGKMQMRDLRYESNLSDSSVSRNSSALTKTHRYGKDGHNLIESIRDPRDRRRKVLSLTPEGEKLKEKLVRTIQMRDFI